MSPQQSIGFFTFSGRRSRKSYFNLYLRLILLLFSILFVLTSIDLLMTLSNVDSSDEKSHFFGFLYVLSAIALIILPIAALIPGAQRCRDFGWTGWAVLLCIVPYLGLIFWLAIFFIPGTNDENRYGPNPLDEI